MIIKGILIYMGWGNEWVIVDGETKTDIKPLINDTFRSLNTRKAVQNLSMNSFELVACDQSPKVFDVGTLCLTQIDGFGWTNVSAFLESQLMRVNGRTITMELTPDKISFTEDPSENVLELQYDDGNFCSIPEGKEKEVCMANGDTCIFLTASSTGFQCAKFCQPTSRTLLDRAAKGDMRARRIGGCRIIGRKHITVA